MKTLKTMLSATALAVPLLAGTPAFANDAGTIRHLMMAQFDTSESRLTVEPVTVHRSIAVAGWAQGDVGGRALLRRLGSEWRLILCSGDTLKEAKKAGTKPGQVHSASATGNSVVNLATHSNY